MRQQKNNLVVYILLMQFFSLNVILPNFEELLNIDNKALCNNKALYSENYSNDCQDSKPSGHCSLYVDVRKEDNHLIPIPASYVIAKYGSIQLKNFLITIVTPMIRTVTIGNYYCGLPGYGSPHGLRDCFAKESQFARSDTIVVKRLNQRIEAYCTRIENILFDKKGIFYQTLSSDKQIKLGKIYAEFLQEFYGPRAKAIFEQEIGSSHIKQDVLSAIAWDKINYNDKDYVSSNRQIEQRYAGSINGNLGAVYVALHTGDSEKAYMIGQQRVKTEISRRLCGTKEKTTSVFEQYPALQKIVEQRYFADKAKAQQEHIAQQKILQEQAAIMKKEYEEQLSVYSYEGQVSRFCERNFI